MARKHLFLLCFLTLQGIVLADVQDNRAKSANVNNLSIDQQVPNEPAGYTTAPATNACCYFGNDTEFRLGYFYPTAKRFREIFRNMRLDYEIETTQTIYKNFAFWANVSWFPKHGYSIGMHDGTSVNLVPISVGLKYIHWFNDRTRLRIGAGVDYFLLILSDHGSPCVRQHLVYQNVGGVLKSDISRFLSRRIYMNLFFDYLYLPLSTQGIHQAGGFKTGLGLGCHF